MLPLIDRVIKKGVLVLLLFTPLAFGSVQRWAVAVMEIISYSLLCLVLLNRRRDSAGAAPLRSLTIPSVLAFVFFLLVLLQLLPLPPDLLQSISPLSLKIYRIFGPSPAGSPHPVSINPHETTGALLKMLAYFSVFYVIVSQYRTEEQLASLVKVIVFFGCFLVVFAVLQKMTWNGRIFWLYPVAGYLQSGSGIWGSFVNRNHFAGYMELAIPLGLGLLLYTGPRARALPGVTAGTRLARFMADQRFVPFMTVFLGVIVMAAALFMTLSRGGIAGFGLSFVFFVWITQKRRSLRSRSLVLGMIAAVITVVIVIASWNQLEERFESLEEQHVSRLEVWKDSLGLSRDFLFFGSGLGTFESAYLRYQTGNTLALFDHAHNDYIELLTDTGIAGFVIAGIGAVLFFITVYRRWRRKRGLFGKCIGAGALASLMAIVVHSTTDFNLHIPANALLFSIIAGIAWAAVFNIGDKNADRPVSGAEDQSYGLSACKPAGFRFVHGLLLVIIVPLLYFPVRDLVADALFSRVDSLLDDPKTEGLDVMPLLPETLPRFMEAVQLIRTAHRMAPLNSLYPKALSELYIRLGNWAEAMEVLGQPLPPGALSRQAALEKAWTALRTSIRLEPTNPDYHLALADLYASGFKDEARADAEYDKAIAAFPASVTVRTAIAERYLKAGRKGDALEQARLIARLDQSYILPDTIQGRMAKERRDRWYMTLLYNSYLFHSLDIAWRASGDPMVVRGITPDTPDAGAVLQAFLEWRRIDGSGER